MAIAASSADGGYSYQFVDTPSEMLVCNICHLPSRDPYLSVCCGHLFCKYCLDKVKKATTVSKACPMCRDEEFTIFPNKQVDREVRSLHVLCTNKKKGCEWQGEVNNITNHLGNSCQFEDVECSNKCGKMLQRRYLTNHVETECGRREVECQYCHFGVEHDLVEGQHKEQCPKLPLPCPNKCEVGSVFREDMDKHRKVCPLEMIQCEYYQFGCYMLMTREQEDKHVYSNEKMAEHLAMTKKCFLTKFDDFKNGAENELTDTKNDLADTKTELADTKNELVKIKDSTHKELVEMKEKLETIKTQLTDMMWSTSLAAKVTLDSQVAPVIVRLSEFAKKKRNKEQWYSDSFYTHDKGYKMCLHVYPDGYGDGKGTHLSVLLYLMKGPYDNQLRWPLKQNFEVELMNQISDGEHRLVTMNYDLITPRHTASRVSFLSIYS